MDVDAPEKVRSCCGEAAHCQRHAYEALIRISRSHTDETRMRCRNIVLMLKIFVAHVFVDMECLHLLCFVLHRCLQDIVHVPICGPSTNFHTFCLIEAHEQACSENACFHFSDSILMSQSNHNQGPGQITVRLCPA